MKFQIQSRAIYHGTAPEGYESSGRDCPTFVIKAFSSEEAARKAARVLNPYAIPGMRLRIVVIHASKKDPLRGAGQFWDEIEGKLTISNPQPGEVGMLDYKL